MNGFENRVGGLKNSVGSLGTAFAGAFAGGLVAGGITSIISGLKDITTEAINVTREFVNMRDAIEFASGSRAAENIQFLEDTIDRLGLAIEPTYKGFKTFQGALMGTTLEGEKGMKIFEAVSEAAAVMKLSGEQTEGTFLALGQMISKGNVQAEELRGQLGERLPGAFNIFARSLGVSTQKLNSMLQKGEVIASETLPKFAAELHKTFGPGVLSAQDKFNANFNRFNNWIYRAKVSLGEGLIPALDYIVTVLPKIDFSPIASSFTQIYDTVSGTISIFEELINTLGIGVSGFTALQVAVNYFATILRVAWTPIRFMVSLIKTVVSAVRAAVPIILEFADMMRNAFTLQFGDAAENARRIKNFAKDFASTVQATIGAEFDKEKQGWMNIWKPITDDKKGSSFANGNQGKSAGFAGGGTKGKEAGVEKIASGTRNITLNISQLIGEIKFEKSIESSEAKVMDIVKRVLLTAVNDVNIVAQ